MKQIHWERWSRFYLPRGHPYLWSLARRVTQPQPRVYNMIRDELALVKQNGAWKPRRKKGWSGLFYPPNGLNIQFCWLSLIFLIAPSWSESNFILLSDPSWSESIRFDPTGLAVRVDPVRLLYLPRFFCYSKLICLFGFLVEDSFATVGRKVEHASFYSRVQEKFLTSLRRFQELYSRWARTIFTVFVSF